MKKKIRRRIPKKTVMAVLFFLAGAFSVVVIQSVFFRRRSIQLPTYEQAKTANPPIHASAAHEMESKIRIDPCSDLYGYVCALQSMADPTGTVHRDSEGEVQVLRLYEEIARKNRGLSAEKLDELLVRKVYTKERTKRLRELFERTRKNLLAFIESQPFEALSYEERQVLHDRIGQVVLELPPPAAVYSNERSLFTKNDIYFERTAEGFMRIRVGGALLYSIESSFNLAFTLAHELAHVIDPCELKSVGIEIHSFSKLSSCFLSEAHEIDRECSSKGQLAEIFADWVATHIVSDLLYDASRRFTRAQLRSALFNSVKDLCREESDIETESGGLSSSHPAAAFRVNRIFAQHPKIREILGCVDSTGPVLPGVPVHCFWPVGQPPKTHK